MQKGNALLYWLKVVSLGLILGLGLQFAQAWTAPSVAPPGGNVSGPLTTSAFSQTKSGYLGVGTGTMPLYPLVVGGDAMISGKVYSFSTVASDLGTTLATKDYVDSRVGGSGSISCNWSGWACNIAAHNLGGRTGCQGYVSGGHSGAYVATDVYCDPATQKVTGFRFLPSYMD